jgi:hypothetical protein
MIRIAQLEDVGHLAKMMMSMYKELQPDYASNDDMVYRQSIIDSIVNPLETVYVHEHGFFIVRDETEPMMPTLNRYNGIRVYIEPEHRKGFLLASFYKRLFNDFPDGDILGMTESNSEHIKVLDKRHIEVARIYILKRS